MSLNHNTTPSEIAEAEADLQAWRRSAVAKDAQMKAQESLLAAPAEAKVKAPVRGGGGAYYHQRSGESAESKSSGLVEVAKCDDADVFAFLNGNQRKKLEKLQQDLCVSDLSAVKRQYKASKYSACVDLILLFDSLILPRFLFLCTDLEKTKGNESFRIAENNDAVACYSISLALDARNAVVWANRAMAYIRLELFDLAEADSTVALHLDPTYVKAYSRRGLVRFKRGKYAEVLKIM